MSTVIIKSKNRFSAMLIAEVAKKMRLKTRVVEQEEIEDSILGKLIDDAMEANEEDISEEEGFKLMRKYGYKV